MHYLYEFEEFINENILREYEALLKKIIFIKKSSINENKGDCKTEREFAINRNCMHELYLAYSIEEDFDKDLQFPDDTPILYCGGIDDESKRFLEKFKIKEENMYNTISEMQFSCSKSEFSKMFDMYDWQPKTVFNIEDALNTLKFPIIAKVDNGHSGVGIKIFKTANELKNFSQPFDINGVKHNFKLYSEYIDIDREYRTIFLKDKCIIINERIANIKTNKTVETKEIEENVDFIYIVSDMNKVSNEFKNKLYNIAKEIRKKIKLGLWAIDVVVDKQGNMYVLEINSAPGLGSEKLAQIYCAIYEDYYGTSLSRKFKEELNKKYISQSRKEVLKYYKREIAKSPWAIDYDAIDKKYNYIEYK